MSTQIYITNDSAGCKPEYTKIVSSSFNATVGTIENSDVGMFFGGYPDAVQTGFLPLWSGELRNYKSSFATPGLKSNEKTLGIPIPVNLITGDILSVNGTAYFNNINHYKEAGYETSFMICVSVFDCSEAEPIKSFTVIPVHSFLFNKDGSVCFSAEVKLSSNYDLHTTRFLIGATSVATCPSQDCLPPSNIPDNVVAVSYTFDVERPCFTKIDSYIIKNCCEPLITELVHVPNGLIVGNVYVDNEKNCWEVISESTDVTNFTRNFTKVYDDCATCQSDNGCPSNLVISSCCVAGIEYVTGSLPGLNVGDTFVDNNGLCWTVDNETSAPISEESITVGSLISGTCVECTATNPCPTFYVVQSCCVKSYEIIASLLTLNQGDAFVDQQGRCWGVAGTTTSLPTNYNIDVVTVYPYDYINNQLGCQVCVTANTCPSEYFVTIRACCDQDRIEVVKIASELLSFSEGSTITDIWSICWEVMSIDITGTETYTLGQKLDIPSYEGCKKCIESTIPGSCVEIFQLTGCITNTSNFYMVDIQFLNGLPPVIGSYYVDKSTGLCYHVDGYGKPNVNDPVYGLINFDPDSVSPTCEECLLHAPGIKKVQLLDCCSGETITAIVDGVFELGSGYSYNLYEINEDWYKCYQLIGVDNINPATQSFVVTSAFLNCTECTNQNPC